MGFLKTNLVSNWRGPVEKKEGEKKRKRRWRSQDQAKKVWMLGFWFGTIWFCRDLTLDMNSIMNHMDFGWDSKKVYEFQI